ncbi:uncharacterized protein LOC127874251 [Dreissena polymorpha]|uniref:Uncharacterized protein n=1 Tax=Dreissena polymorpha TaxID=45954 RepID=A0A9D4L2U1_DREPO|nr:uncharacterized protein LOC127874251 [Dreissena polymorpha]KAH3849461.1 hypothetical protein DPMN_091864 [Dreissena polymorpha]
MAGQVHDLEVCDKELHEKEVEESERHLAIVLEDISFEKLFHYDFLRNSKFMHGWKNVRESVNKEKLVESFIKAQVFFYNREIEQVNYERYVKWLAENKRDVENTVLFKLCTEESHRETSASNSEDLSSELGNYPQSFMELVEMIQRGEKLPNTLDLDIEPLNIDPTPAIRELPLKPWEIEKPS